MGRRIDVELTSRRDDGTWTWRAAGARQPKGVVDAALLYEGVRVGDVVRAEADFEMEGILITAVSPPKEKKRSEPERLEIIGTPRTHEGVTSSLVPKSERPRSDRSHGGDRDRGPREGGARRGGPGQGERRGGAPKPREDGPARDGDPSRGDSRPRPDGRPRPAREAREGGGAEPSRRREAGRPERAPRQGTHRPDDRERRPAAAPAAPAPPRPKRLVPANVHRAAVVETLPPEQRPVAEQLLRGGIPAVRQAIDAQNARLREEGQSEVHAGPLVALAEQLLPQLKAAEWRDRAEAAIKVVDDVSLRDLRSVVSGADAARDDEGRLLAGTLRQGLERRVNEQRERWVSDISAALDEGRLVRALRLSAHPPDPSTRFPAELAVRLSEAAGAAMTAEATPDRWATLLEAVAESPVRRSVKPQGLPAEPGEPLLHAARQASGRVPALAALLGIKMPPPPGPPRSARPSARAARPPRPPATKRRPPPPPRPGTSAVSPDDRPAPDPDDQVVPTTSEPPPGVVDTVETSPAPLPDGVNEIVVEQSPDAVDEITGEPSVVDDVGEPSPEPEPKFEPQPEAPVQTAQAEQQHGADPESAADVDALGNEPAAVPAPDPS